MKATITDNGSNFVKVFSTFSSPVADSSSASSLSSSDLQDNDNDLDEEETTFKSVSDALTLDREQEDQDLTQIEYELPVHERCAAHTLNLVASSDKDKSLSSSALSRSIYRSSFAKCCTLWNKASRSSQAADQIEDVLKQKLIVPMVTSWNSYFNAVQRITENSLTDLNELCSRLDLFCLSERELLPTLETILKKVRTMKSEISSTTLGLLSKSVDRNS